MLLVVIEIATTLENCLTHLLTLSICILISYRMIML